jgi:dTDP-4-dehydrorhamnose reductase
MDGTTLVFGAGWIGTQMAERLSGVLTSADIADEAAVRDALDAVRPDRVVNCAGRTGRPNVDALESHPESTLRSNVVGPIVLASACRERGIHITHLGSGCLYSGDKDGAGFTEADPPNFNGSLYARSKALAEGALSELGALQLRLRLPISEVPGPRNLLTKLLSFDRVIEVENSITVMEDFWDAAFGLMERRATGIWNVVNPGVETHGALLGLYRDAVDPTVEFEVIDALGLGSALGARSNCLLSTAKLQAAGLGLPPLTESLPRLVRAYGEHIASARA